ncbi:MAG: hypothetical protein KDA41_09375, partial [Planctomycetales bacterium]|nr:hypothetical protein [Planctomycetales bacterium]
MTTFGTNRMLALADVMKTFALCAASVLFVFASLAVGARCGHCETIELQLPAVATPSTAIDRLRAHLQATTDDRPQQQARSATTGPGLRERLAQGEAAEPRATGTCCGQAAPAPVAAPRATGTCCGQTAPAAAPQTAVVRRQAAPQE